MKTCWRPRKGVASGLLGMALLLAAFLAPGAQAYSQSYQALAPSPVPLTSVAADPGSGLIYAQQNGGKKFFVYNPRTDAWGELAEAPISSGNNGGAAYLNGRIYTVYTENESTIGVYDILSNSWTTLPNSLGLGTGNITSGNGKLYLAGKQKFISYEPATGATVLLGEPPALEPQATCNGEDFQGFEPWGGLQFDGATIYGHQGDDCNGFGVYTFASNSWAELPRVTNVENGGPVLGSALDPVTATYLAYGDYGGDSLFRYDIEGNAWTSSPMPWVEEEPIDDGGMAYLSNPGIEGVYIVQGEKGEEFLRYNEKNVTDLSSSMSASVMPTKTGGEVTYSVAVKNNGPERASGVNLADTLPAGTSLLSLATSQGTCSGTTCALGILKSGASAAVTVKVSAPAGTFTNAAAVSSLAADTNASNDGSSIAAVVPSPCKVPKLKGKKVKGAKKALKKAQCKPGKVKHVFSGKVKKGRVVKGGKPGKSFVNGTKINLSVSKGAKPKKAHHKS